MLHSTSIPQEIITHLHYSRRLLLTQSHSPLTTTEAPTPTYQVLDPTSSHDKAGFDANIIMILAVLITALMCSFCINTFIRCVIKCSSILRGEPNYYLNIISDHDKKRRLGGVDKRALKTFPVVKYSKEGNTQGLGTECVICLSEFKGDEKIRVLPKCNHGFHIKCIDRWLSSHSSCPTCRQSLVETCQKIIGCGDDNHATSSSPPSSSTSTSSAATTSSSTTTTTTTTTATTNGTAATGTSSSGEMVAVSIVPLEREDLMRNYRGD